MTNTTPAVMRLLVVEKRPGIARRVAAIFADTPWIVESDRHVPAAMERFDRESFDIVLVTGAALIDARMSGGDFVEVMSAKTPHTQVIVLVQPSEVNLAFHALKAGSYHYIKFPVADDELKWMIETALERQPRFSHEEIAANADSEDMKSTIVGRSKPMRSVYRLVNQAAASDIPVLIVGETGTGKDLVAQAIHLKSPQGDGPYVPVHLGALPQELVASELFGHEKGAFTGAHERRMGKFEQADGGSIFLDEISTIDERVQVSLLRLIEQRKFNRIGGKRTLQSTARIITATNEDPAEMVDNGLFRQDLLYRLDVFRIPLPPLRERHGDIPLLVDAYISRYAQAFRKPVTSAATEAVALLEEYDWPGNVRELKNVIQRAVLVANGDTLLPEHLPSRFNPTRVVSQKATFEVGTPLAEVEREMIVRTLSIAASRKAAAEILGISRRALYNKMDRYGIA